MTDLPTWLPYNGTGQPVDDNIEVDIACRGDSLPYPVVEEDYLPAYRWDWTWDGKHPDSEIVAYRVRP